MEEAKLIRAEGAWLPAEYVAPIVSAFEERVQYFRRIYYSCIHFDNLRKRSPDHHNF